MEEFRFGAVVLIEKLVFNQCNQLQKNGVMSRKSNVSILMLGVEKFRFIDLLKL